MKEKILFVNSCVRGENESRTFALAKTALSRLDGDIEEIRLADADLKPLDAAGLAKRAESAEKNDFSDPVYDCAKQFAACDTVVIAAPFWDYSFPALLKIYIESLCVGGLTFLYGSDGVPISYCRAKKLIYITTSGGYIGDANFGFEYIRTVTKSFFGIENFSFFSAEGLDILGNDPAAILKAAQGKIEREL